MIHKSPSTSAHVIAAASILRQAVNSVNRTYAPNGSWRPLAAQMRRSSSLERIRSLDPSPSVFGPIPRTTGEVKSSDLAAYQFSTLLMMANTSLAVAAPLVSVMLSRAAVIMLRLTEPMGCLPNTGTTSRSSRRWYWPAERNLRPSIRRNVLAISAKVSPSAAALPCGSTPLLILSRHSWACLRASRERWESVERNPPRLTGVPILEHP